MTDFRKPTTPPLPIDPTILDPQDEHFGQEQPAAQTPAPAPTHLQNSPDETPDFEEQLPAPNPIATAPAPQVRGPVINNRKIVDELLSQGF